GGRRNQRPSATQGIPSRSGGRGYNQPIRPIAVEVFTINVGMDRDHGRGVPLMDREFIQPKGRATKQAHAFIQLQVRVQADQSPVFYGKLFGKQNIDGLLYILFGYGGQKS